MTPTCPKPWRHRGVWIQPTRVRFAHKKKDAITFAVLNPVGNRITDHSWYLTAAKAEIAADDWLKKQGEKP